MPVPDEVYFGPSADETGLNYGQVRAFGEAEKHAALKRRLKVLFVGQVSEMAKLAEDGKRLVYAPFPLFLMTCVGIETLGKVFYHRPPTSGQNEDDVQRDGFLKVCTKIDAKLSRPLNKAQKKEYDSLWGSGEHQKVTSYSHIIYRLGRHTMVHGYRGKGVYFTEDSKYPSWAMEKGAVIVNPYWFWDGFTAAHEAIWGQFVSSREPNSPLKLSINRYLSEMLD